MFDYLSVLQAYLGDQATLIAQVSTRIWRNGVPQGEQSDMPRKSVCLISEPGGSIAVMTPRMTVRAQARCYGGSPAEAVTVAQAFVSVAHRVVTAQDITWSSSTYRLFWMRVEQPGYYMPEPETEWDCWLVPFTAQFAEDALS